MTDPNTISEHRGTNAWTLICIALVIAGQTVFPFLVKWNYFNNGIYDALVGVLVIGVVYSIVKARKAVWSNDLSPNGMFALGWVCSIVSFALPVIWHAGWMNHNLQ